MRAITIGNFDGVHLGHVALVRAARELAPHVAVVTFEPHPLARLRPGAGPPRITDAAERRRLLLAAGATEVLELDPTPELLARSPEEFVVSLRARLPFDAVIEGPDFRFGRGREGTIETLRQLGEHARFAVRVLEPVDCMLSDRTVVRVSSTLVRWLLARGRVGDAAALLGRPYAVVAPTVMGERRGRTIGCPTLNLAPAETILPADGVYGGHVELPGGVRAAAAISVGTKPMFNEFGESPRVCEVHVLDAAMPPEFYGRLVRVEFETWIREQWTFPSVQALIEQIGRDIAEIRTRLGRAA